MDSGGISPHTAPPHTLCPTLIKSPVFTNKDLIASCFRLQVKGGKLLDFTVISSIQFCYIVWYGSFYLFCLSGYSVLHDEMRISEFTTFGWSLRSAYLLGESIGPRKMQLLLFNLQWGTILSWVCIPYKLWSSVSSNNGKGKPS